MATSIVYLPIQIGQRFGRWVVLSRDKPRHWLCQCDCGTQKAVYGPSLKTGLSKSCGCLKREATIKRSTTHGHRYDEVYNTWLNIKQRCDNPNNPEYKNYGARGITVCERWRENFDNFRQDMGPRPPRYTVERKDNSGNYEPDNCVWASQKTQGANRRNNKIIEWNGEKMTLTEAALRSGLKRETITYRLKKIGLSVEEALTAPLTPGKPKTR
jgi:hypothetical protein